MTMLLTMWTSEVFEEMPMVKNDIPRCYLNLLHPTDLLLTQGDS